MRNYWLRGCPVRTYYYDSLSSLFPAWETLFAEIVTAHLPSVQDADLRSRMERFIAQETAHKNAHHAHNKRIDALDAELGEYRKVAIARKRLKSKIWLAAMVSIEHIAASISRRILRKWGFEQGREVSLFRWHSMEELEHKALAIDLWDYLGYSREDLKKTAFRNLYYVLRYCANSVVAKLRADGLLGSPRIWTKLGLLGADVVWHLALPHAQLLRSNFHPSEVDDSHLLARLS